MLSLNFLLPVILGLIVILYPLRLKHPKAKAWVCFLALMLVTGYSYWCFMHYSHAKDDKFYKNTNSCVLEVEGVEFPEGQSLMLCSNSGDSSLWVDNAGDLRLQTGTEGCFLESGNLDKPLYTCKPRKASIFDKLLRRPTKVFRVVNLSDDMTLQPGDSMTIRDVKKNKDVLTLKYEIFKKREKWYSLKKTYDRFIFKTDSLQTDTIETKFKRGDNLHHFLTSKTNRWLSEDREIIEGCYLVRDHFAIDNNEKDKDADMAVHLFCNRTIQENDSVQILINGRVVDAHPSSHRHCVVDSNLFCYGIEKVRNNVWSVERDGAKVRVKLSNPLRYNFPQDTVSGRSRLFLTTDMQEIIDRQGQFDCFYRIFPGQANNSPYAAKAILSYQSDSAHIALSPKFVDLNDPNNTGATPIAVNADGFSLRSAVDQNDTDGFADLSYLMKIRDFRTSNHVHQYSYLCYCFLLLLFAVVFGIIIAQASKVQENDKERYCRKIYVETVVYMVLMAFLTVRQIMLWRLQSFPPISNNITSDQMARISDKWNFWLPWIAVFLLLVSRVFMSIPWMKKSIKKVSDLCKARINKFLSWKKRKNIVAIVIVLLVSYAIVFYIGKTVPGCTFLKVSITVLLFCLTTSVILVKLFAGKTKNDKAKMSKGWYVLLIINILCFCIMSFFMEAGLLVPFFGFVGALCLFLLFYEKPAPDNEKDRLKERKLRSIQVLLMICAALLSFLSFSHLSVAKQIAPLIPEHRMAARMEAMVYEPKELFSDPRVEFRGQHAQEILNATSNYWFIDNHNKYRKETLSKSHPGFQPVQEYTQKAVYYLTQTRDLVVLRYLNFEHGYIPIVCLCVSLFLLFVMVASHSKIRENHTKWSCWFPALAALFLLVYAIYLALVNVNAVVFVGLDFPFLTLTSNMAPVSFILFLFAIVWYFNSSDELSDMVSNSPWGDTGKFMMKAFTLPVVLTIFVIAIAAVPIIVRNRTATSCSPDYYVQNKSLVGFIQNNLNPEFETYQDEHRDEFQSQERKIIDENIKNAVNSLLANRKIFQGYEEDSTFILSVFAKAKSYSDLDYLVYAKKSAGYYRISGRSRFNHLTPIFAGQELERWHGDLLAADVPSHNLPTINDIVPDTTVFKVDRFMPFGQRNRIEKNVYNLPGRYCYDGQTRLLFRPIVASVGNSEYTDRYVRYTLIPQGDVSQKLSMRLTCQILPKDILVVEEADSSYAICMGESEKQFLAKRIHYNGRYETIYPLGGDFMFAASFDKMLREAYVKQGESNPNGFGVQDAPVKLGIDYDLTVNLSQYFRRKITKGSGITVTAIDGNGCVRLLGDYDPHALYIDPNDAEMLDELRVNALLNGEAEAEREAMTNRNVRWLPAGPGSTIKPVFYAAIASKANLNWPWFQVQANGGKTDSLWTHLGDYSLSGVSSEIRGEPLVEKITANMGVASFIKTSNNFFFGALLMLGTYPEGLLEQPDSILKATSSNDNAFPVFKIGERYYKFKGRYIKNLFAELPWESGAALERGLRDNFRYGVVAPNAQTKGSEQVWRNKYRMGMVDFLGIKNPNDFVLPETPHLYRQYYVDGMESEIFRTHLNIVHGGSPLSVSPLIMAEAFLRIAQGNSATNLITYSDREEASYENFKCSSGYAGNKPSDAYWNGLRKTLFAGMWDVIHSAGGTLYKGENILFRYQNELANQKMYLYGKTGTCNSDLNHHYAFILSNQKLHGEDSLNRETLKVYVVYFGFYGTKDYGHTNTQPYIKEVLSQIIQSETFKKYWYGK